MQRRKIGTPSMSSEPIKLFENLFETARSQSKSSYDSKLDKLTEEFRNQDSAIGGWPLQEAFLGLLVYAAAADGQLASEEKIEIHALAKRSRVLKQLDDSQLGTLNQNVMQRLSNNPNGLKEACESLPGPMRMSVFAHCADIVLADREFRPVEEEFLKKLVTLLDLQTAEAASMMQSLLIKNRF
jgi:uncharacterized tellurite resistance protein B-like protein